MENINTFFENIENFTPFERKKALADFTNNYELNLLVEFSNNFVTFCKIKFNLLHSILPFGEKPKKKEGVVYLNEFIFPIYKYEKNEIQKEIFTDYYNDTISTFDDIFKFHSFMNGFLSEIETIIENQSISLIKKSVKIPISKNLTFTQYKNDYALLLENYLKQYVDNTEQTFIKQQLLSFNECLAYMVNGTINKAKKQILLEDLELPTTLDDLKQSTEQKIEFLEDKLKEVSNNKAPQLFELKTETKDQKPRPKKIAEKWYALLYRVELEANEKKPPTNREGQFIKRDIEAYREQTTKSSGQAFYREFIKIDLKNKNDLFLSFDKDWKKKIIELSNNDQKIIKYLEDKYV